MADDDPWREIARHGRALATLRAFGRAADALRLTALIDGGDAHAPVLVELERDGALTVSSGEETFLIPDEALDSVSPLAIEQPPRIPATALLVDVADERIEAPLGALERLIGAVVALARGLGGRSVASIEVGTRSGEELTIAAREGEQVVLAVGEVQFTL